MRVAITGSSGLIGSALKSQLSGSGHEVLAVVRRTAGPDEIEWDPAAGTIAPGALDGVDAVIHLAGAGIGDKRWTDDYKRQIRESRTRSTNLISEAIAATVDGPRVMLSASGVGFYGDRGDESLDESSSLGTGFLAEICRDWEASTAMASASGCRVAMLRTGIVLSPDGGALKKQLPLFKLGLGGRFGSGKQWQSWISITDEVGAIEHLLTSEVSGPVNLTAPAPVTSAEFASTLGKVLKRPAKLPVPSFGPKLLLGGELTESLLLSGQRALPKVLTADGYTFAHPDLESALRALLGK
jgi:uncharacterized protein (TIGR01777 family)